MKIAGEEPQNKLEAFDFAVRAHIYIFKEFKFNPSPMRVQPKTVQVRVK